MSWVPEAGLGCIRECGVGVGGHPCHRVVSPDSHGRICQHGGDWRSCCRCRHGSGAGRNRHLHPPQVRWVQVGHRRVGTSVSCLENGLMVSALCLGGCEDARSYEVLGPAPSMPKGPGAQQSLSLLLLLTVCPHFPWTRGQEAPESANEESPRFGHDRA